MTGRYTRTLGWVAAGALCGLLLLWWRVSRHTVTGQVENGGSGNRPGAAAVAPGGGAPAATGSAPAAGAPPRFVLDQASTAVQNDPRASDYDPRRLIRIGKTVDELFAAEPRIAIWAAAREKTLRSEIGKDLGRLVPGAHIQSVECRSSTCLVTVDAPEDQANHAATALALTSRSTMSAVRSFTGGQGRGTHEMFVMFGPEHRAEAAYRDWYNEERRRTLGFLRKTPAALPHLDHARLPEE